MTDKPYTEPLGGSYVVEKPGAKPVRKEWTEHDRHGAPGEGVLIVKPETAFGLDPDPTTTVLQPAGEPDKTRKGK